MMFVQVFLHPGEHVPCVGPRDLTARGAAPDHGRRQSHHSSSPVRLRLWSVVGRRSAVNSQRSTVTCVPSASPVQGLELDNSERLPSWFRLTDCVVCGCGTLVPAEYRKRQWPLTPRNRACHRGDPLVFSLSIFCLRVGRCGDDGCRSATV
eukprot:1583060-Rhodomonas_salina.6